MRRVIFGALTVAVAALAAIGIVGRRRWAIRDDALPLEPAPPLGSNGAVGEEPAPDTLPASTTPSVDADFGFAVAPTTPDADAPAMPVARSRRKKTAARPAPSVEADYGVVSAAAPKETAKPRARPRRTSAAAAAPSTEGDAAPS
jgi:hypothetical protein